MFCKKQICPICYSNFNTCYNCNINTKLLYCGHIFHKTCINEWLQIRRECPICRTKISINKSLSIYGHIKTIIYATFIYLIIIGFIVKITE